MEKRILLAQTSFPGDTILSTPVIAALAELHPTAKLWILTNPAGAEILNADPLVSGVVIYDKRGADRGISGIVRLAAKIEQIGFEKVYSLHRSFRTSLLLYLSRIKHRVGFRESTLSFLYSERVGRLKGGHEIERNLSLLGDASSHIKRILRPRLFTKDDSTVLLTHGLSEFPKYGLFVPGSVWETKRWEAAQYSELARWLKKFELPVVLLGSKGEYELCQRIAEVSGAINLAGKTSLTAALSIIKHSAFVVCNDSMALHAASAFDLPVVAVFGPTTPAFGFGPSGTRGRVVEITLPCRPCSRHGSRSCPKSHFSCMRGISAQKVAEELQDLGAV